MQQRIQQVQDKVAQLIARAEQLYGVRMPAVRIRFDLSGRAAGIAGCMINRWTREASDFYLRFNTSHMRSDTDWPHLINDVVPHEIAHTVCQAFPRLGKHHDAGWQRVCLALGGNGRRTYSAADAPEAVARQRPVQYVSTTGARVNVSHGIHRKIQAGKVYLPREGGRLTRDCEFSLSAPVVHAPQVKPPVVKPPVVKPPVVKPAMANRTPAPVARTPGASDASLMRALIAQGLARGLDRDTMVQQAQDLLGFSLNKARAYYRSELPKVQV